MNNRTIRVVGIIVLIVVAAYAIAWISAVRRTGKYLADLSSQEPDKVMDALAALRERGRSVGPKLVEMVRAGQSDGAPRAAWLLGMIDYDRGAPDLMTALQAKDPVLRIAAMQALGQLRPAGAVQPLGAIMTTKEEQAEIRIAAAYALGAMDTETAAPALMMALAERPKPEPPEAAAPPAAGAAAPPPPPPDPTVPVRLAAARALGRLRQPSAVEALATAITDAEPDAEVRVAAAYALGDVAAAAEDDTSSDKAIHGLIEGLADENGDVRTACAYALGKTRPSDTTEQAIATAIGKAEQDDHYWARLAAARTSQQLRLPD